MRRALFFVGVVPWLALGACVGDDPLATASVAADSGQTDGATSTMESGGAIDGPTVPDSATIPDGAGALDADAAAFDVRQLPGLRLWLEGSKGVVVNGGAVSSWSDSTGRVVDGGGTLTAAHVGAKTPPSFVANGINGKPSISFPGADNNGDPLQIDPHPDLEIATGDFLFAFVIKVGVGDGDFYHHTAMTLPRYGLMISNSRVCTLVGAQGGDACTDPPFAISTDPHVVVAMRRGKDFAYLVDGTARGTRNYLTEDPNVTPFNRPHLIGQRPSSLIAEIVHIIGPTTDPNRDALTAYLKDKYAIP